ncbi:MAG: tRNA 2-selenouridine(34) synthase MnmH [Chitinophagaceae bacterium]|nr:tRNA 2-selenouridine(34) synthase MnmH [Chitinophagaceae bacterium]
MAIEKLHIDKFLTLAKQYPVFDVRSPGEFNEARIPGAFPLALFDDEQRKIVGTIYKQQSREAAIKAGLDFFGTKMKSMVEEVEKIVSNIRLAIGNKQQAIDNKQEATGNCILIHCWRGGMRSAGVAWLLDLYGFKVYTLTGGYKSFRSWVLNQFEKPYSFKVLGGYTGSGKTVLLKQLADAGQPVIDLEGLANHKGSAFGALGEAPQPGQEMFENLLASELFKKSLPEAEIWLEDESQRIGKLIIPKNIWQQMREVKIYFLEMSFDDRLEHIIKLYGNFKKEDLVNAIMRIQKRLGGLETKNAVNYLLENNVKDCFIILLKYYDKLYTKGLYNRKNLDLTLNKISCTGVSLTDINNLLFQKVLT